MKTRRSVLATLGIALAGCRSPAGSETTPRPAATAPQSGEYWYPHPRPTGNRTLDGAGDVRTADPVTIPVANPAWLVALPSEGGSDWVIVSDDGTTARYQVEDGTATRVQEYDPFDGVPVVHSPRDSGAVELVRRPPSVSSMAPPAFANGGRTRLGLGVDGDLLVTTDGSTDRVPIDGLADGRIVRVSEDQYALLGDATDRYRHGALGDTIEGGSLVVVDGEGRIETRRSVGPPAVVEAQAPLVADLDDDGQRELLVPISDRRGARIVAYAPDGTRLATGPIHGSGWRHPLAVAPFGPDGCPELAVVRKPHVEHVLEFYRLDGSLSVSATLSGVRSHTYGSRNLDGGLAADLDGDGRVELLVPTTAREALIAVRRTSDGARVAWRLGLDGQVRTNLAGVALDGRVAVGVGTDSEVRVWQG